MKYDVTIIGSGLGGLICGYILSKNGYSVRILEKNKRIGGCMQSFIRDGVLFDTGMHYIGSVEEGQILFRFWKYLSLLDKVKLRKLDPLGFDVISIGGNRYRFAMGYDNFVEELSKNFPDERHNIEKYVKKLQIISAESPLYNLREIHENVFLETDHIKTSVNDFMCSITSNNLLQNILAGNLPLYAGVKDKTPVYIHALTNNLYITNSYRVVGGGDTVAESLADSIREQGGIITTQCEAEQIICSEKEATGILLSTGELIESRFFISNIHPQVTTNMLNTPLIRKAYRERIGNLENTVSNFTLYICFRKNRVPYMNNNFYSYSGSSVWGCEFYDTKKWPLSYLYMHQAPADNSDYASGALVISYMQYNDVKKWEGTKVGNRGADYLEFKKEKAAILLDRLEKDFPGIRSEIKSYTSSTPLTYRDYTATKDGSLYGILRDKNFPVQTLVSQRTRIPNLFLTGQNINAHGVLGVTIGAIITCAEFLGINNLINDIRSV